MDKIKVTRDVVVSVKACNFLYDRARQFDVEIEAMRYCGELRVKVTGEPERVENIFNALFDSLQQ